MLTLPHVSARITPTDAPGLRANEDKDMASLRLKKGDREKREQSIPRHCGRKRTAMTSYY